MRRPILIAAALACIQGAVSAGDVRIQYFRMRSPQDRHDIEQASDLYFGRLGERDGLWTVCDRNGNESAGKIYFISKATLKKAKDHEAIVADEEFTVVPPAGEWSAFAQTNRAAGDDVLSDVRKRMTPAADRADEPFLDLEAMTVAPSPSAPHDAHLFVVAEEPYSTVLELNLEGDGASAKARLVAVYAYHEAADQQGTARNDGLEGLAYAGKPGEFFFAEEGTLSHDKTAKPLMMFRDPLLGRATLKDAQVEVDRPATQALSKAVQSERQGAMQTLNALTMLRDGKLLAVDRNGGWILRIDPEKRSARRWLNLYDLDGKNLREVLAHFPGERKKEYISIEGIAVDDAGAIWLVDDPAMPEGWRASCLVRIDGPIP